MDSVWSGNDRKSAHDRASLQSSTGTVTWKKKRFKMYALALNVDVKERRDTNCYANGSRPNTTLICNITKHVLNVYLYTAHISNVHEEDVTTATRPGKIVSSGPQKLFKQGFDHREGWKKKKDFLIWCNNEFKSPVYRSSNHTIPCIHLI